MSRPDTRSVNELIDTLEAQGFERAMTETQGGILRKEDFFNSEGVLVTVTYFHMKDK